MVIRHSKEAHHIQISGDTGSGKSTLVRTILYQIEERGETAIVFDPDREYLREFYQAARGDVILNPKDQRCPYWAIGEEADDEAEATPIAEGLFPDHPTAQFFFLRHSRAIFAYLLAYYRPTVNELGHWMAHPDEIDIRVKDTEHAHTMTENAPPQRAGILGTLNEAGMSLRMMPSHSEGRQKFTVRDWARKRTGWIFVSSTPDTIDALRPLQGLWLDMLDNARLAYHRNLSLLETGEAAIIISTVLRAELGGMPIATISELARRLGAPRPTMTRKVERLAKRGLLHHDANAITVDRQILASDVGDRAIRRARQLILMAALALSKMDT